MEKFCCCLDLVTGVNYFSFGLIVIWIIYFIQSAIFGGLGTSGVQTLDSDPDPAPFRWDNMGGNMVWCECPLLPRGCLWDQEVNEVLPLASSLHQVSQPPPSDHHHAYLQIQFLQSDQPLFICQRVQCGGWCDQRNHQLCISQPFRVSWGLSVFLAITIVKT